MFKNKSKANFKYDLGSEAEDTITGYRGIIICRCQWLANCNTYGIRSRELKDGQPLELQYFDEPQIKIIKKKVIKPKRKTGGPCVTVPQTNR